MVISVDLSVIYILICFLLIFWVARKTLFVPLDRILDERRAAIESARELVRSSSERIELSLKEYEARINEARGKGSQIRKGYKDEGLRHERTLLDEAREKAAGRNEHAAEELRGQMTGARRTLGEQAGELAELIAQTVVGGKGAR